MTFSTVYLLFCWWSNQQRFLRLNKQSNATEPRKKRRSLLARARLCVSIRLRFSCQRRGDSSPNIHVYLCSSPLVPGRPLFPIFHSISHRNSTLDFCFVLISVAARVPRSPHAQEIFFYYFSIILSSRVSLVSLSIPIAVVVFVSATLPGRLKKIASLARWSTFTLSIDLLSDPPYISELLRAWER